MADGRTHARAEACEGGGHHRRVRVLARHHHEPPAAGYLLALAETMAGTYVAFAFSELIAFALLVLVLVFKPTGLFTKGV